MEAQWMISQILNRLQSCRFNELGPFPTIWTFNSSSERSFEGQEYRSSGYLRYPFPFPPTVVYWRDIPSIHQLLVISEAFCNCLSISNNWWWYRRLISRWWVLVSNGKTILVGWPELILVYRKVCCLSGIFFLFQSIVNQQTFHQSIPRIARVIHNLHQFLGQAFWILFLTLPGIDDMDPTSEVYRGFHRDLGEQTAVASSPSISLGMDVHGFLEWFADERIFPVDSKESIVVQKSIDKTYCTYR